jgi:hypothetical protein
VRGAHFVPRASQHWDAPYVKAALLKAASRDVSADAEGAYACYRSNGATFYVEDVDAWAKLRDEDAPRGVFAAAATTTARVHARAGKECGVLKGSSLGRFPLVSADFWTGDHLSERS